MPSPPLVPGDRLIDTDHLTDVTFGDPDLQREVLSLFIRQAEGLMQQLTQQPAETASLAHLLKGSARSIGAFSAADCAERLEQMASDRKAYADALAELKTVLSETIGVIDGLLRAA